MGSNHIPSSANFRIPIFLTQTEFMLVIVQHIISDPDKFWSKAKTLMSELPTPLRIHSILPSKDKRLCVCLWQSNTVEQVQSFLDTNFGTISKNFSYEVNEGASVGLPTKMLEESMLGQ